MGPFFVDKREVDVLWLSERGSIRKWARIEEVGKYLRVIILDDGETVHDTFFDRYFKKK